MQLDRNERQLFLGELGLEQSGLQALVSPVQCQLFQNLTGNFCCQIKATYKQLGLQTYFTTGEKETRAWTIKVVYASTIISTYLSPCSVDPQPHKPQVSYIRTSSEALSSAHDDNQLEINNAYDC